MYLSNMTLRITLPLFPSETLTATNSHINTLPHRQTDQYSVISHLVQPNFSIVEAAKTQEDTKYGKFDNQRQTDWGEVGVSKMVQMEG